MGTYQEEVDRQADPNPKPLFKEKRVKNGWILNLIKPNDMLLSTSLYDESGMLIENKVFISQHTDEVDKLSRYIKLFEEDPQKNLKAMSRITRN